MSSLAAGFESVLELLLHIAGRQTHRCIVVSSLALLPVHRSLLRRFVSFSHPLLASLEASNIASVAFRQLSLCCLARWLLFAALAV